MPEEVVEEIERIENLRRKEKGREREGGGDVGGERGGMETLRVGLNSMGERSGAQRSDFKVVAGAGDPGSREEKILDGNGRFMSAVSVQEEEGVLVSVDTGTDGIGGIGSMICDPVFFGTAGPTFGETIPLAVFFVVGRQTSL
jgi:hypothetical protein